MVLLILGLSFACFALAAFQAKGLNWHSAGFMFLVLAYIVVRFAHGYANAHY